MAPLAPNFDFWTAAVAVGTLVALVVGALLAWRQLRAVRQVARDERTLQLHREWTDGSVACAREGLSSLMVDPAPVPGGATFYRLDWAHLVQDAMPPPGGRAGGHRSDVDQVFVVLWFFQRLRVAQERKVASPALVTRLFERDIAWWGCATDRFPPNATHLLQKLGALHRDLQRENPDLCAAVNAEFHAANRLPAASTFGGKQ